MTYPNPLHPASNAAAHLPSHGGFLSSVLVFKGAASLLSGFWNGIETWSRRLVLDTRVLRVWADIKTLNRVEACRHVHDAVPVIRRDLCGQINQIGRRLYPKAQRTRRTASVALAFGSCRNIGVDHFFPGGSWLETHDPLRQ